MNVPSQLSTSLFRFIILGSGKTPIERGWQKNANYSADDPRILASTNVGILCGHNGLVVIDFDDRATQEKLFPLLPPTFTVRTGGKGLYHLYYVVDEPRTIRYNDPANAARRVCDVQGPRTQVVAPGSKNRDTGKTYDVVRSLPITHTKMKILTTIIEKELTPEPPRTTTLYLRTYRDAIGQLADTADIRAVARYYGIKVHGTKALCPFHADKNPSLSFETRRGLFHCFGCETSGNTLTLVEKLEKCSRADAIRKLAEITGVPWPPENTSTWRAILPEVFA